MTESEKSEDLRQTLQPFYDRASQAEERLSRLESALAKKEDARNGELLKTISELQAKLEEANAEVVTERKKAEKLAVDNEKLNYRVKHLIRALEAADLNSKTA